MLKMNVCKSRTLCTKEISFQSLKNVYSVFTIRHLCLREQSPPFVLSEISKVLFEPPVHKKNARYYDHDDGKGLDLPDIEC